MTASILTAFIKYPDEAAIIGRLLAGYSEIEFQLTSCLGHAIDDNNTALRALFRIRSERDRISVADALMRNKYKAVGLENQYADAIGAVRYCRKIRNQFAHCHWIHNSKRGLAFMNLEAAAETFARPVIKFRPVNVSLLQEHEEYFCYALDCLKFLDHEILKLRDQSKDHQHVMPQKRSQPTLYNPPKKLPNP